MEPGSVVEHFNVVEERGAGVGARGKLPVINGLVLRAAQRKSDEEAAGRTFLSANNVFCERF